MARINLLNSIFDKEVQEITVNENLSIRQIIEQYGDDTGYDGKQVECYNATTGEVFYETVEAEEFSVVAYANEKEVDLEYIVSEYDCVKIIILPLGSDRFWVGFWGAVAGVVVGAIAGFFMGGIPGLIAGAVVGGALGAITGVMAYDLYNQDMPNTDVEYELGESQPDVAGASNQPLTNTPFPTVLGKHLISPYIVGSPVTEYRGSRGEEARIKVLLCAGYAPLKLTDFRLDELLLSYNRTSSNGIKHDTIISGLLENKNEENDTGDILSKWKANNVKIDIIQQVGKDSKVNYGTVYDHVILQQKINATPLYIASDDLNPEKFETYKGVTLPNTFRNNTVRFSEQYPKRVTITLDCPEGLYRQKQEDNNMTYTALPIWYALQYRIFHKDNPSSIVDNGDVMGFANPTQWKTFPKIFNEASSTGKSSSVKILPRLYSDFIDDDIRAHTGNNLRNMDYDTDLLGIKGTDLPKLIRLGYVKVELLKQIEGDYAPVITLTKEGFIKTSLDVGAYIMMDRRESDGKYKRYESSLISKYNYDFLNNKFTIPENNRWDSISVSSFPYRILETTDRYHAVHDFYTDYHNNIKEILKEAGYTITNWSSNMTTVDTVQDKDGNTYTLGYSRNGYINYPEPHYYIWHTTIDENTEYYYGYNNGFAGTKGLFINDNFLNSSWYDTLVFNLQSVSGKENDGHKQMRFQATIELSNEEIDQIMSDDCTTKSIEVRMVRISPSYIDETRSSGYTFKDVVKWATLTTEPFDYRKYNEYQDYISGKSTKVVTKEEAYGYQRPMQEDDYKRLCFAAVEISADATDNVSGTLDKVNCMAENFAPIWDKENKVWFPLDQKYQSAEDPEKEVEWNYPYLTKKTEYKDYITKEIDGKVKTEIVDITEEEYLKNRHDGVCTAQKVKAGNNYLEIMQKILFKKQDERGRWVLEEEGQKYLDNNTASQAMYSVVGPHLSNHAMDYDAVNKDVMGELYEFCESVQDGTKDSNGKDATVKYACNGYLFKGTKYEDLLSKVFATGRSVFTMDSVGKLMPVTDKPVDYPVGIINQSNCIKGSTAFTFDTLPSGLCCQYNNENDGYNEGLFYAMADGEDYLKPTKNIESYSMDYVTNPLQMWSLSRYLLAVRIWSREILTRTVGIEGHSFTLGDVVLVQDEGLLIGDGGGRIKQLIEDDQFIYGFITDDTYPYTGETEIVDGAKRSKQGVTFIQPRQMGKSRVVTLRLCTTEGVCGNNWIQYSPKGFDLNQVPYKVNEEGYPIFDKDGNKLHIDKITGEEDSNYWLYPTVGETNVVLFETRVKKGSYVPEGEDYQTLQVKPETGNIVCFGEIDKIVSKYRITNIKINDKKEFEETLTPYDERFYNYGTTMPVPKTVMTIPDRSDSEGYDFSNADKIERELEIKVDRDKYLGIYPKRDEEGNIIDDHPPETEGNFFLSDGTLLVRQLVEVEREEQNKIGVDEDGNDVFETIKYPGFLASNDHTYIVTNVATEAGCIYRFDPDVLWAKVPRKTPDLIAKGEAEDWRYIVALDDWISLRNKGIQDNPEGDYYATYQKLGIEQIIADYSLAVSGAKSNSAVVGNGKLIDSVTATIHEANLKTVKEVDDNVTELGEDVEVLSKDIEELSDKVDKYRPPEYKGVYKKSSDIEDVIKGDWFVEEGTGKVFLFNGANWIDITNNTDYAAQLIQCMNDVLAQQSNTQETGSFIDLFAKRLMTMEATIQSLQTQIITLTGETAKIQSAAVDSDGNRLTEIDSKGNASFLGDINIGGKLKIKGGIDSYITAPDINIGGLTCSGIPLATPLFKRFEDYSNQQTKRVDIFLVLPFDNSEVGIDFQYEVYSSDNKQMQQLTFEAWLDDVPVYTHERFDINESYTIYSDGERFKVNLEGTKKTNELHIRFYQDYRTVSTQTGEWKNMLIDNFNISIYTDQLSTLARMAIDYRVVDY